MKRPTEGGRSRLRRFDVELLRALTRLEYGDESALGNSCAQRAVAPRMEEVCEARARRARADYLEALLLRIDPPTLRTMKTLLIAYGRW